jgi:tetratricopeptide (TPR) repeat protein
VATSLNNIGKVSRALGRFAAALAAYREAQQIASESFAADHPRVLGATAGVGLCELELGRAEEAIAALEAALVHDGEGAEWARRRFALARALIMRGGDRDRALSLAQDALSDLRDAGSEADADVAAIDAWLARHYRNEAD